jgi:enoyl-CoA hydratase
VCRPSRLAHRLPLTSCDTGVRIPAVRPALRYEVDGPIAVLTLDRPEAANALDAATLDQLDAHMDAIDADESVAAVVVRAEGPHFCAGHDLKELLAGEEAWAARRATPEGRLRHELARYWAPMVRLRDLRPITIAAVQGACSAAGLMLACMCDLIVTADDARFSNPVARMSGVGVELLVEPWEVGPRKAKELLLLAQTWDAATAERLGLVNRVVPRDRLWDEAAAIAADVALVPPLTAEAIKRSINGMLDRMGQRDSWQLHFWMHQFVSATPTAIDRAAARAAGGMAAVKREQAGGEDG